MQRVVRLKQCYIRNGLECKLKQDDGGSSVCFFSNTILQCSLQRFPNIISTPVCI